MKCNAFVVFKKKLIISNVFLVSTFLFLLVITTKIEAQSASEGKELFKVCAACHSIGGGDLVGPDLKDVTEGREQDWLIRFIRNSQEVIQSGDPIAVEVFEAYNKIPMPPNDLSDDEILSILAYIEAESKGETVEAKETQETIDVSEEKVEESLEEAILKHKIERDRNYSPIFWISLILFILAVFDLAITRFIKARFVNIVIIIIAGIVIVEIIVTEAIGLGRQEGYSPDQPIAFSHKIHVKQNKIDCKYCHHLVEKSKHAGIPSVNLCMNCHNAVKEGKTTGKEEIAKIYEALENEKPINWIRVHNMPDHVFFSHAQHVKVGELDCTECHGNVEDMDRIMQVNDLSMGFCINCHRERKVTQFDSNEFYEQYVKLHERIKSGELEMVTVEDIGGNDCQKCHY